MNKNDAPPVEPGIVFDDEVEFVAEVEKPAVKKTKVESKVSPKPKLSEKPSDTEDAEIEFVVDSEFMPESSTDKTDPVAEGAAVVPVVGSDASAGGEAVGGRLGDKLIAKELITPDQLNVALQEKKVSSKMLGEILVDLGFIDADVLSVFLADVAGFGVFDPKNTIIDSEALSLIEKDVAHKHSMLPYSLSEGFLHVAMADPYDVLALDTLKRYVPKNVKVKPSIATSRTLDEAIDAAYGYAGTVAAILKELESQSAEELDEVAGLSEDEAYSHPLVRLVNSLIFDAVKDGVSDLHFEPEENFVRLRCRKDGVMATTQILHKKHWNGISQRLKIMASLNIADKLAPQDGRIQMNIKGHEVDFRVSSLPTVHGENIVMRVLDKQSSIMPLAKLGFSEGNLKRIKKAQKRPEGIIIVTGPTGSGKTTSLYSMLNEINTVDVNIQTLEDPVEYSLPMIRQTHVREGVLDFADGIRALLRQDPDIIFIGEIRDKTTAEMALQAAMTGHQVYTTLHTNDSFGALPRLFDLGMVPGMIAGNIISVFAQRLARTLCENCKEPYKPTDEEMKILGVTDAPEIFNARQGGCSSCAGQGYAGRVAIAEVLLFDEVMDEILARGGTKAELKEVAVAGGFKNMKDDAMLKILEGRTTFEAVSKAVDITK